MHMRVESDWFILVVLDTLCIFFKKNRRTSKEGPQLKFTCSKSTTKALEKGVKYVQI